MRCFLHINPSFYSSNEEDIKHGVVKGHAPGHLRAGGVGSPAKKSLPMKTNDRLIIHSYLCLDTMRF
jgi:hypothetical protein